MTKQISKQLLNGYGVDKVFGHLGYLMTMGDVKVSQISKLDTSHQSNIQITGTAHKDVAEMIMELFARTRTCCDAPKVYEYVDCDDVVMADGEVEEGDVEFLNLLCDNCAWRHRAELDNGDGGD